jgi:oxygen-dependent protoporphyrinogen oxidase
MLPSTGRGNVVVVGGGLAGLTTALRLARSGGFDDVTVLEASDRLGGQIWTSSQDGFLVERGGEGFVFRSEAVAKLASDVGVSDALIGQATFTSYGFGAEGLVALAPGQAATFLGFQVPTEDLGRGIRSLRGGMGTLTGALERALRTAAVTLCTGMPVTAVSPARGRSASERAGGAHLRIECTSGKALHADAVIVATPAADAARTLHPLLSADDIRELAAAQTVSSVTVELAFERSAIDHALDGTGFVVATELQQQGLRACTFTTSKFEGRAPEGCVSLRAFFRPLPGDLEALDDAAWTARAVQGIARALPLRGSPLHTWVSRWPHALPVHSPSFRTRIERIEPPLAARNVHLAGAAFHGSGIDAAVRSAEHAASKLAGQPIAPHSAPP